VAHGDVLIAPFINHAVRHTHPDDAVVTVMPALIAAAGPSFVLSHASGKSRLAGS